MAEGGVTVANAYVQIMPSMEGATGNITKAIVPDIESAGDKAGVGFGGKLLGGIKGKLVGAGAAIVGAMGVATIVNGLVDIGTEFKDMENTIIVGTGASGEALDGLCESAKNIATTVPTSFSGAGDIVQDLNTRLGMTAKDLEDTGNRVVALEKMMGESVDMSKLTGTMNAFGISNDQVASKMDYLFGVSQATGIGFNDLTGILESSAPAMMNLGFSMEQSANMAGLLDKAGMDASGTMSKMSKALVNIAEPGQSAQDAFRDVIGEMQGYIEAGDTASALDVASKVFGTKGAAQFVGALQTGAFSLDEICDAALGAGDGIMGTYEKTMTAGDKFEVLKNKAAEALEPIAGALIDGAINALDWLCDAFDNIAPVVETVTGAIGGFLDWLGSGAETIGTFCDDCGAFWSGLADDAGTFFGDIGDTVGNAWDFITTKSGETWDSVTTACGDWWSNLQNNAGTFFGGIKDSITSNLETAKTVGSESGNALTSLLSGDWESAQEHAANAYDAIKSSITDKLESARGTAVGIADAIGDKLGFPGLGEKVSGVFDAVKGFIEDPIGTAKQFVHDRIEDIKGFFNFNWHLPELKLPHIVVGSYIEVPVLGRIPDPTTLRVDWYASGGIIDGAKIIGVGEAGPEAVVPLTQPNLKPFAQAVAWELSRTSGRRGSGEVNQTFNIYANDPNQVAAVVAAKQRRAFAL